jgi:hypothetical protein
MALHGFNVPFIYSGNFLGCFTREEIAVLSYEISVLFQNLEFEMISVCRMQAKELNNTLKSCGSSELAFAHSTSMQENDAIA